MAKLLYAEPDDEITNLVDRLRSEKEEKELVFVVPPSSRVLHSSLNARLLMQYSNSLGKQTRVVSSDPRTQQVAIDTGFPVFPSVDAFQAGSALDQASSSALAGTMMAPIGDEWTSRAPERPRRVGAAAAGTGAAAARTVPRAPRAAAAATPEVGVGKAPYLLAAIGFLLVVMMLAFVLLPTATITIITSARPISATVTVTGTPNPPAATDVLAVQTVLQQSEQKNQQQFPATGTKTIPATPATGTVTVKNQSIFGLTFQKGKGYTAYTDDNKVFVFVPADDTLVGPGQSHDFAVTAQTPGAAGNVAAHAINHCSNTPTGVSCDNAQPTTGGADPVNKVIISQADLDKAKSTLGDPLAAKVKDDLTAKAGSLKILPETQVIAVDAQYDHKVNDEAPNFTATVTVKGKVTTVDDAKVRSVLAGALRKQISADFVLTADKLTMDYKVASHDDNGGVVFDGTVAGFEATKIDLEAVKKQISGKSPAQARALIKGRIDASDVIIKLNPPFLPMLPYVNGHIDLRETVERPK